MSGSRVSRGTIWTQPCPAARPNDDGQRLHYYRRPVVSVDHLNDLRALAKDLVDAIDSGIADPKLSKCLARLRDAVA